MSTAAHERIESIIETNDASVLVPILKGFDDVDILTYQKIGVALMQAFRAGIVQTDALVKKAVGQ